MSRPLRIESEGAVYHLTSRGNARQNIYEDDTDRSQIQRQIEDSGGLGHAFRWARKLEKYIK